ncbi:hypothetical protein ACQP2X_12810 [Actinoplanes sp. CA-131856]
MTRRPAPTRGVAGVAQVAAGCGTFQRGFSLTAVVGVSRVSPGL